MCECFSVMVKVCVKSTPNPSSFSQKIKSLLLFTTFLSSVLKEGWAWWDKLGTELYYNLYVFMHSLTIPPLPTKASRGVKRCFVQQTDDHPVPGPSTSIKHARTGATQANWSELPVLSTPSNSTQTSSARPHKWHRQEPAPLVFPSSLYESFFSQLANTPK